MASPPVHQAQIKIRNNKKKAPSQLHKPSSSPFKDKPPIGGDDWWLAGKTYLFGG